MKRRMLIGEMAVKVDAFSALFDEKRATYAAADRPLDGYLYGLLDGHGSSLGHADDVRPICGEAVTVSGGHDRIHLHHCSHSDS